MRRRDVLWLLGGGAASRGSSWSLGGVAGHAGLFGTAADVARFAQLFLDGGALDTVRVLKPQTVAEMTRSQIEPLEWRGLGWELNVEYYMRRLASPGTYGHTGFTGTSLVVDPERELIVVLLGLCDGRRDCLTRRAERVEVCKRYHPDAMTIGAAARSSSPHTNGASSSPICSR